MNTDRYAVMGNPVAHSKSPQIHTLFAAQAGQNMEYTAILVEHGEFSAAVEAFQQAGGKGLNITVPFKQEAWVLADERSARAERAGAVNTLMFKDDGRRFGDNTDGVGLVRDLTINHTLSLSRARVLVLGAGGAVRGVLGPLLAEHPEVLVLANRTVSKAVDLAKAFASDGPVEACSFNDLAGARFDVIINGTAASLHGEVPALPLGAAEQAFCYDMMYGREPTAFLQWASGQGAKRVQDGLGMLVEQAAEAFHLWRGVRPDTGPVIKTVRDGL